MSKTSNAIVTVALVALVTCVLAACGGSSSDDGDGGGGGAVTSARTAGGGSGGDYLAVAKKIAAAARSGVVYSPTNEYAAAEELQPMVDWLGPTESPAVPSGRRLAVVSCGATPCNEAAEVGVRIASDLGFSTELVNINGRGDLENLNQALSAALAMRPDAIITVCVSATQVADKLEEARKNRILTISVCDPTPTGGNGQYDAAADYPNGLSAELLGWSIVAESEGRAHVVAILDRSFPSVIRKIGDLERILRDCEDCDFKTVTWQITDAVDSGKAANILTGVINGNPDMDTLVMPYSVGMQSVVQAVQSSGRDIRIYADDADDVNIGMVKDGSVHMISAVDPELVMHQAIDQVIRGLGGEPFVEPARLPYLAHLYTQEDVPDTAPGAFVRFFDYRDVYDGLWGQR